MALGRMVRRESIQTQTMGTRSRKALMPSSGLAFLLFGLRFGPAIGQSHVASLLRGQVLHAALSADPASLGLDM